LRELPQLLTLTPAYVAPQLRVFSFAQPPVGDAALRQLVRAAGWEGLFRTVVRIHCLA